MAVAQDAAIVAAEAALDRDPESVGARHALLNAYFAAGRLADAERAGREVTVDAEIDEASGWVINDHGIVLNAMGRFDDADARLAQLNALDIEANPWLINMIINRADRRVFRGNWDAAEAPLAEAERRVGSFGSPYAQQLVRKLRLCQTVRGGAAQAPQPLIDAILARKADGREATIDGLICAGQLDAAEAIMLEWLADPETSVSAIEALQPQGAMRAGDPSIWRRGYAALYERSQVRKAFDARGRVLPKAYWPAAR